MKPALLVLALPLAASACGATTKSGPKIVPWVDRPLPRYSAPDERPIRYPASAPLCRSRQLRATPGLSGGALGTEVEEVVFTNRSRRPCLLRGYPTVSAVDSNGRRTQLRPGRGGGIGGPMLPADLGPGGHVFLDFLTSAGCITGSKPPVRYHALVFTLPQGGQVWGGRVKIYVLCGLSISTFGLPQRYAEPRGAPGGPGTLAVTARFPQTVRPGTTLRFTITLSNPTRVTVRLNPCPGYTLAIYDGAPHIGSFALNCDSVKEIRPHGRVRYAMQIAVPPHPTLAVAKLSWSLDTPSGPFAGAGARIVG